MSGKNTGIIKVFVLIAYFIVVGILAAYSYTPESGEVGFILARLTPHLVYIPLVLTALWYPQEKFAHLLIFLIIIAIFTFGFLICGWCLDVIFTLFTSFIYLWVYFAILYVPSWKGPLETEVKNADDFGGMDNVSDYAKDNTKKTPGLENSKSETSEPLITVKSTSLSENLSDLCDSSGSSIPFDSSWNIMTSDIAGKPEINAGGDKFIVHTAGSAALKSSDLTKSQNISSDQVISLINSFKVRDREIISQTFRALESIGPFAEPYLISALQNPNLPVRENSAGMLGILKSPDSICSLIDAMDDESKKMHNACVQALAKIGEPAIAPLFEAMFDEKWRIRAGSCAALRIIGVKGGLSDIASLLQDDIHYVRKESAKSLGRVGDESVVDDLCEALNDNSRGVRLAVVNALGRIKSEKSIEPLLNLFKTEKDCQVRERIVDAFGRIGGEKAYEALKYAAVDFDPEIRSTAKDYLFGYGFSIKKPDEKKS